MLYLRDILIYASQPAKYLYSQFTLLFLLFYLNADQLGVLIAEVTSFILFIYYLDFIVMASLSLLWIEYFLLVYL